MANDAVRLCFECRAVDGRIVRLTRARYDSHILDEHPDLTRDFVFPIAEIQKALETALSVTDSRYDPLNVAEYVGPLVAPNGVGVGFGGPPKPRQFSVIVWKEPNQRGHVLTAYAPVVRLGGKR